MNETTIHTAPPRSESDLLQRATALAGFTLSEIAEQFGQTLPTHSTHAKGWAGQLIESLLGGSAGSKSAPDFEFLGIELKTLPVRQASPTESTFVCTIPLTQIGQQTWATSQVYRKLNKVLWIPVDCPANASVADRRIGMPLLWSPSETQLATLKADWESLTELICLGQLETITASLGDALQIRPKGANAKALVTGFDEAGNTIATLPRGFYLRPSFTKDILTSGFHNPSC